MFTFCPFCGTRLFEITTNSYCDTCKNVIYMGPRVASCALIIYKSGIVFVLRKQGLQVEKWSLPGGILEMGENPLDAAVRETFEETGLVVKTNQEPIGIYFDKNDEKKNETLTFIFLATVIEEKLVTANDVYGWRIFPPSDIPWEMLAFNSTREAILEVLKIL